MTGALEQLAALVHRHSGIRVPPDRAGSLAAALARSAPGADPAGVLHDIRRGGGVTLLNRLVDELAIKETSFLREPEPLRAIDWRALLRAAHRVGSPVVGVWSAACATGEEAWSLALLAAEAFATAEPPVQVLGTDLSASALAHAERGVYGRRALRALTPAQCERHFKLAADGLSVSDALRRLVDFRCHNLVHDPAPPPGTPPLQLILCRNVLIYFDTEVAGAVTSSLEGALAPGGRLLLGSADRLCLPRSPRVRTAASPSPRHGTITPRRPVARRPRATVRPRPAASIADAIRAADDGRAEEAMAAIDRVLRDDPANADAHLVRGVIQLAASSARGAVDSLRRALYIEPGLALAAFTLGRAHDALGDRRAARRAYERALATFDPNDARPVALLDQVDVGDLAAACRIRLLALSEDVSADGGSR